MPLTDIQCKNAQPKDKQYKLTDGGGLSLLVHPNGSKYWVWRFKEDGHDRTKSIGIYPAVGVRAARTQVAKLKMEMDLQKTAVAEVAPAPSFSEVAEEWLSKTYDVWKSQKHIKNVRASLDELYGTDQMPVLRDRPIDKITAPEVLAVIRKIEQRGSLEISKRTLSRCGMVMKYAIACGHRTDNPCRDLSPALQTRKVENLPALDAADMPQFIADISAYPCNDQVWNAIWLVMLTGVRINELLESRWTEFDLDQKVWDIPTERMKNGLPHRVPLSTLAIEHLQQLRLVHRSELLFPHRSIPTKPMTSASVLMTIKRAGYGGRMTTHGFRSVFSTAANESRLWHEDVIERQLAHVPKNRIRGAYNRAAYWDDRVALMDWYEGLVRQWLEQSKLLKPI